MIKLNASRLSLTASVIALTAAFGTPAFAQSTSTPPITPATPPDQPPSPPCPPGVTVVNGVCTSGEVQTESGVAANPTNANAIIVTGSRIKRPNLESPVPITSISQQELTSQGQVSVGDALNDLPALRSTFSQQNSGRFIGTAGQNFLDLRGLGTARTLVLVNGRRMITAAPGDFTPDVDNIPQDLIDRIDVVTGGESAIYGSDAVAGVVNFVLKRDFEGWRVRGQGGESTYGDRPVEFISTTFGKNFADGRGNIAMNLEYTHAGELFFRDRSRFQTPNGPCGFVRNDFTAGEGNLPGGSDGIPDNVFRCGLRNVTITTGGTLESPLFLNGSGLVFDPNGNLVFSPPCDESFIKFGSASCVSNSPLTGATIDETGDLAVGRDRYSASLLGHFDITDAFKPFVEGLFVHQVVHQEGQPSFFQGRFTEDFFGPIVPDLNCNNGFLTAQNLAVLQDPNTFALTGGDVTCDQTHLVDTNGDGKPDTPVITLDANGNPIFDPNKTLPLNRFNVDWGARKEEDTRDTFRVVAGFTGDFNEDWHYEVSVNYGHTSADNKERNDLQIADQFGNPAGFALAIDAVAVDAAGNIVKPGTPGSHVVCRSTLTDPGNGCVPINPFGEGQASPEAIDFVNTTSHLFQAASELDFLGFLSGDTSQFLNLPGGPIGFSVGFEHRKETAESHADPVSAAGGTFFNAFSPFNPPPFKVTEFFGELNVPILKDLPFAHELTVSGAARRSHYNTSAGNTFTWNANAIWAPVRDIRFRGNYSKSVRVPTLNDLFSPASINFNFVADPCDSQNIGGNPNRAANCAALGVPTTIAPGSPCIDAAHPVGSPFVNCVANSQTIQFLSAGNPNLTAETGKSITVGGVLTPRFVPGFSLSVDYFDIKVSNLISFLSAQQILNSCVDAPNINNNFCALINPRDQFGLLASPALLSAGVNFAEQKSRGIDFDLSYRHHVGPGRLDLRGFATYTLERTDFTDPTNPKLGNRILSELGDPVFSGTAIAGYTLGHFDLRYTLRYIGSMTNFNYEDNHKFPPACTPAGCPPFNADRADRFDTGAVWYHDIRVGYTVNKYNFYVGVDNIFNRLPPLGLTGVGAGSGIYSDIGRFVYAGAVLDLQ
jgi:outer membrane receptor protein involved in Fe transport